MSHHKSEEFNKSYAGTPPWDIGRPQAPFQALADSGELRGKVLDAGCGTGEHALLAARLGLDSTGVDFSPAAIALAQAKARERGITARFLVHDALRLADLGEQFDTVLDSGLFHCFDDDERRQFVTSLESAMAPRGRYFLLCFSDRQPGDWGPRRLTQAEIRANFAEGWRVDSIEPVILETILDPPQVQCWFARITRV